MHFTYFKIALLLNCFSLTSGEIKIFGSTLAATSGSVHYTSSYLIDPGSVDLTYVTFTAGDKSALFISDDDGRVADDDGDDYYEEEDDYYEGGDGDDDDMVDDDGEFTMENTNSTEGDGDAEGDARSDEPTAPPTEEVTEEMTSENTTNVTSEATDESTEDQEENTTTENEDGNGSRYLAMKEFTVDVLFFHEPSDCAKTKEGCNWFDLGVGAADDDGDLRWCCSETEYEMGMCSETKIGRVIIDESKFKGEHRFVNIPASGSFVGNLTYPLFTTNAGNGQYTLLLANCNDYGRDVQLDGKCLWESKGGFLPGDKFEEWRFIILITLCYAVMLGWYGLSMKNHKESRIGIQMWILGTIFLGLLHSFLKSTDYAIWNNEGFRSDPALYTSVSVGVIKGAISRCLLIMVSLGWGVIRDTLGDQMKKVVMLGLAYLFTAFCRDVSERVFVEEIHILSVGEETAIYDFFTLFTLVTAAIDVICYMWILDALNGTMQYLENMNQTMKLKQYLRLRLILLLSILFALFWTVLGVVDTMMETAVLAENQAWVIPAAWSVNYFFLLSSIAWLWRPNPRAKEFAYVMELPSLGEDLDFDTNIGPDGIDDDDEAAIHHSYSGGLQNGNGMKIDNAVST